MPAVSSSQRIVTPWPGALANVGSICSSWVMHPVAIRFQNSTVPCAQGVLLAGNNNRANNNANHWRARA